MIAEERTQTLTLFFQLDDTEILTAFQDAFLTSGMNQAIGHMRIPQISDGIEIIRFRHINDIADLCRFRFFLRYFLIRYGAIEIAIVTKQVCGYFSTCFAIDG